MAKMWKYKCRWISTQPTAWVNPGLREEAMGGTQRRTRRWGSLQHSETEEDMKWRKKTKTRSGFVCISVCLEYIIPYDVNRCWLWVNAIQNIQLSDPRRDEKKQAKNKLIIWLINSLLWCSSSIDSNSLQNQSQDSVVSITIILHCWGGWLCNLRLLIVTYSVVWLVMTLVFKHNKNELLKGKSLKPSEWLEQKCGSPNHRQDPWLLPVPCL